MINQCTNLAPPASHENRGEPRLSRKAGQAQLCFTRLWSQEKRGIKKTRRFAWLCGFCYFGFLGRPLAITSSNPSKASAISIIFLSFDSLILSRLT